MLVTMRGEWAEFNPWQVPMGHATETALRPIGVRCLRADTPDTLVEISWRRQSLPIEADQQIAVFIGQRMIGEKKW